MENKKIVTILGILTVIFAVLGGTLAYWQWSTSLEQRTNVTFTVSSNFSCAADGGGSITSGEAMIAPASCTNSTYAIQRTVTVTPTINKSDLSIYMDLWLDVNKLDSGLSNSKNFKYALTTVSNSCTDGVIATGSFNGMTKGDRVKILNETYNNSTPQTYYLYIWLDAKEESPETMNQTFNLSLGGSCTDLSQPEAPVLDDGMIPVTISDTGVVTTVSKNDADWYNYENQEWANVVLVNENATSGVTNSKSREYYLNNQGVTVSANDILGYYVWIPRYKYRIPTPKCSEVNNPTMASYPSCYSAPYMMSDTNKEYLITWFQDLMINMMGLTTYTKAEATTAINEGLNTGTLTITMGEESQSMPTLEAMFQMYTDGYEYQDISETEASNLATLLYTMVYAEDTTYTEQMAVSDIDNAIHSGLVKVYFEPMGTLEEFIAYYNEQNETDITYTKKELIIANFNGSNSASNIGNPQEIDIRFESATATLETGDAANTYRTHPAFWWDNDSNGAVDTGETKAGIWVGKFETTGSATTPTVLPNTSSLRSQNVSIQFTTSLKLAGGTQSGSTVTFAGNNTYGLTTNTDSHMMKNSEWGAVAYLSHSTYGINEEIRINNFYNSSDGYYKTGCGALEANGDSSTTCQIPYGSPSNEANTYPQSTTGNISGVFDMSGGAWEYTMGVLADSEGNPRSGYNESVYNNSGFNGTVYTSTDGSGKYTAGITFPDSKYYNLYTITSMSECTLEECGGHALYETESWYDDFAQFVSSSNPWFLRGGDDAEGVVAGAFYSYGSNGYADGYYSWRSVLVVG